MQAERASGEASRRNAAPAFDAAAAHWQAVVSRIPQGPFAEIARRNLADTRFRAWQLGPSSARGRAAIAALTAYLELATTPERRKLTEQRLRRVRGN